jgi:hypothetical protein
MEVQVSGMVTVARLEQPEKAYCPMDITPTGIVMLVRPDDSNAQAGMELTPFGIVTLVMPEQRPNAFSPMDVTVLGMMISVKPLQPANASLPMEETLLGMVKAPVRPPGHASSTL